MTVRWYMIVGADAHIRPRVDVGIDPYSVNRKLPDKLEFEQTVKFLFVYRLFTHAMYAIVKKWEGCRCLDI